MLLATTIKLVVRVSLPLHMHAFVLFFTNGYTFFLINKTLEY